MTQRGRAGHQVALHVAARSQRGQQAGVDAGDRLLEIFLQHAMQLDPLPAGEAQRAVGVAIGQAVHDQVLRRRQPAAVGNVIDGVIQNAVAYHQRIAHVFGVERDGVHAAGQCFHVLDHQAGQMGAVQRRTGVASGEALHHGAVLDGDVASAARDAAYAAGDVGPDGYFAGPGIGCDDPVIERRRDSSIVQVERFGRGALSARVGGELLEHR